MGYGIAVDASGSAYVTGKTRSGYNPEDPGYKFPTTEGAFDPTFNGHWKDAFVAKLDPTGSRLVYSTFLGGDEGGSSRGYDTGYAIAVDAEGNAYVTGETWATNFPTTPGAFDRTFNDGGRDVFVTKLDPTGSSLIYSTYLGGGAPEEGQGIAVDASGNVFVTGITSSSAFPTTPGAFDRTLNVSHPQGGENVFVTKLHSTGSSLVYSTFIGGGYRDVAYAIAIDALGHAYITGTAGSSDFPITPGASHTLHSERGWGNAFVTKLDPTGSSLVYSTCVGSSTDTDTGRSIALDASGNVYVTGYTESSDFPTTPGAFDRTFNRDEVFVIKLSLGPPPVNQPPVLATAGDQTVDEGQVVDVNVSASDPDGTIPVLSASNLPTFASFTDHEDRTGTLHLEPDFTQAGDYPVEITATDSEDLSLTDSETIMVTVNNVNRPPLADAGSDQTVQCSGDGATVAALDGTGSSDPDSDPLTYQWSAPDITFDDPTSPAPTATFPLGTTTVTLVVNDGTLPSDPDDVVVTIVDTTPPEMVCPVDDDETPEVFEIPAGEECTGIFNRMVTAHDACDGDITVVVDPLLPLELNVVGEPVTVTYTATDASGNTSTCQVQAVLVDVTPPTVTLSSPTEGQTFLTCQEMDVVYSAQDLCDDELEITVTPSDPILPPIEVGDLTITVSAKDGAGNVGQASVTVHILPVPIRLDIDPNTLNIHNPNGFVTAHIQLLECGTCPDIVLESIQMEGPLGDPIGPITDPKYGWVKSEDSYCFDSDGDGINNRMVKFDRALVCGTVEEGSAITLTLKGSLENELLFEGSDVIEVISKGKKQKKQALPGAYILLQNVPNPFNSSTEITYGLPERSYVRLIIYNLIGQEVTRLVDGEQEAGYHTAVWDASGMSGGIYLYRLEAGQFEETKRMLLLK